MASDASTTTTLPRWKRILFSVIMVVFVYGVLDITANVYLRVTRGYDGKHLYEFDFDLCQKEGLSIVGDPEHVIREIRAQARELGVGVLVGLFQFGSLPHDLAVKNIRLFGEKVLPELKRG